MVNLTEMELSEADFDEMPAATLKGMWDKLRESHAELRSTLAEERRVATEQDQHWRGQMDQLSKVARALERKASERDARLALVALKLVDLGVLDAVDLAKAEV